MVQPPLEHTAADSSLLLPSCLLRVLPSVSAPCLSSPVCLWTFLCCSIGIDDVMPREQLLAAKAATLEKGYTSVQVGGVVYRGLSGVS
jgi:hypothetical protein